MSRLIESTLTGKISKALLESSKITLREQNLNEDWKYTIKSGSNLRKAIDEGDPKKVLDEIQNCCLEVIEKSKDEDLIDEFDRLKNELNDEISMYDEDEIDESVADYWLGELYDLCDNAKVFVGLQECDEPKEVKPIEKTRDELIRDHGTDNVDLINAGKEPEERVELKESLYDEIADFMKDLDPYGYEDAYDGDAAEKHQKAVADIENDKQTVIDFLQSVVDYDESTADMVSKAGEYLRQLKQTNESDDIETPTAEDLEADDKEIKEKRIKELEDRIAQINVEIGDPSLDVADVRDLSQDRDMLQAELDDLRGLVESDTELNESAEGVQEFWSNFNYKVGDEFETSVGKAELLDNDSSNNYILLKLPTEYVAAWAPELDGDKLVWGQGHYFDNESDARDYFNKKVFKECDKKTLKEDSYEEPFFAEIEEALVNAGFDVSRYSDVGMLTKNLGWVVSNSEGEVQLTCAGTYLDECDKKLTEEYSEKLGGDPEDFVHDVEKILYHINEIRTDAFASRLATQMVEDFKTTCEDQIKMVKDKYKLDESVSVVTNDGSTVDTDDAASVAVSDNTVSVTNGQTTVTITTNNEEPVEPADELVDVPQEEPVEEVPTDDIVPVEEPTEEPEVVEESSDGSFDKEEELERLHSDKEDEEEPPFNKEDELNKLHSDEDIEEVLVKSLNLIKNQGNVYMISTKDENGTERYIVCSDFNAETNECDDANSYDNKEDADKDYFDRVGIDEPTE